MPAIRLQNDESWYHDYCEVESPEEVSKVCGVVVERITISRLIEPGDWYMADCPCGLCKPSFPEVVTLDNIRQVQEFVADGSYRAWRKIPITREMDFVRPPRGEVVF